MSMNDVSPTIAKVSRREKVPFHVLKYCSSSNASKKQVTWLDVLERGTHHCRAKCYRGYDCRVIRKKWLCSCSLKDQGSLNPRLDVSFTGFCIYIPTYYSLSTGYCAK
ncbi:hypothetical protein AVEN_81809-1 [Araneus ventricosus]|uniref:Uncharacterized protein n=1 Tax=Araneus ventricosus TaxID=182803 RepID=A0A4Y2RHL7_ARAVE|nr:hypothetical protein AVEN_81809-1 [Araneus ventricosus]